ncbi:alpha/beta hydrolase fold protein [Gemmatirosa kalamazoonensis]|uniref:Alpha/beta hydrolase fold protein n=1 Tax=Gemmatirosa kalamazoonensis TaxID=861299 RepID=W0RCE5_9BACT|nr:alpha/beta fold hydrolase [Gemmatirosa kalamazoonensis]AHG88117.1 alpha/beta hydrolase fold protein [Gemmatirosa kalamazoonensis]
MRPALRGALLGATLWAARLPAQSDTTGGLYTAADGARIHYTAAGAGPAVVLLHGFLNDGTSWRRTPAYARLVDAGFRVVVVDLRGNGASDKPTAPEAWANDAETRDVVGVAQALGLGEYCVAGYSRGSIVAARLLELDPHVRCAVLGGMGADFTNPAWPRRVAAHRALAGLPLDSAALAPVAGMVRAADQRGLDRRVLAMQQQAQPSSSRAALGRVRVPVLVISGDADQEDGSPEELARLFPRATLVTVPGDHGATMRSTAFADSVTAFLERARHRR